ncbi:endonuclease domain-containing 1 protein-like [Trachemys scripta elegans]|uniref:endonuclease domain-containing 1 protein-like n=1 Tax=Trachemys scripta elegans TaxID=31138 RepID=UPI0015518685|nr:endonuclease domain-containing 1 protein-like [Trachemys scripta elegans]
MLLLVLLQFSICCLMLGNSEVVTSFENTCPQFFFRETPPNDAIKPANPAQICQLYKNQYRFATLYDRDNRIPIYSAYVYQPGYGKRPDSWMVEPQLMGSNYQKEMATEWILLNDIGVDQGLLNESQAVLRDYKNLTNFNRGHLNPNGHQPDPDYKAATFTLTNIVPQFMNLNGGKWNNYEQEVMMSRTEGCATTYVVVGVVPGNNYIAGGRVNKPSHIWSAACCEIDNNHRKSWAVIALNDQNAVELLTLGELEEKLVELYRKEEILLFDSDCPRQ